MSTPRTRRSIISNSAIFRAPAIFSRDALVLKAGRRFRMAFARSQGLNGFLCQSFRLPSSLRMAIWKTPGRFCQSQGTRHTRSFTSSIFRRSQYQRPNVFINNDPVLRQVVQTRQPVLIYQAPEDKRYYAKVYGLAALWIGAGVYSIKFNDDIKERDLAFFVRPTYIFVGFAFIAIGCFICTAPTNRMRTLEILPSLHGGPMQLRMTVKAAPWVKERLILSNLGGATISEKTEPMVLELLEADRAQRERVFEDLDHLSTWGRITEGSSRWLHQKWVNFFLRFKFAVLRFGIAKIEVQGEKWKLDCSGWLLENGKGTLNDSVVNRREI